MDYIALGFVDSEEDVEEERQQLQTMFNSVHIIRRRIYVDAASHAQINLRPIYLRKIDEAKKNIDHYKGKLEAMSQGRYSELYTGDKLISEAELEKLMAPEEHEQTDISGLEEELQFRKLW